MKIIASSTVILVFVYIFERENFPKRRHTEFNSFCINFSKRKEAILHLAYLKGEGCQNTAAIVCGYYWKGSSSHRNYEKSVKLTRDVTIIQRKKRWLNKISRET